MHLLQDMPKKEMLLNVYRVLKEKIFHSKGVPQYALNKIVNPLALLAGEFLTKLTADRYTQVKTPGD